MTNEFLKVEAVMTDDFLKMIKIYTGTAIHYCDLDDIVQGDCINCPYNMSKDTSCLLIDYEKLRLL